jgi:hypothetical protein
MSTTTQRSLLVVFAVAVGTIGLFWNGDISPDKQKDFVSTADAIRGRPLTPLSYAGVARRTTRRAVAVGAVAAPVVVVKPGPTCVQVVNSYGGVTYHCP